MDTSELFFQTEHSQQSANAPYCYHWKLDFLVWSPIKTYQRGMSLSFTECLYVNEDKKYLFLAENQLTLKASNKGNKL